MVKWLRIVAAASFVPLFGGSPLFRLSIEDGLEQNISVSAARAVKLCPAERRTIQAKPNNTNNVERVDFIAE